MAGDWIKVEKDTPDKPEILALAARLGVSQAEAFLACFRAWRWADSHTEDGNVRGVTPALLDTQVGVPGFAEALLEVGWLHARSGSLQFPNFDRHMSESAKKRALTGKRVSRHRVKSCNAGSVTKTLPEKRREEKSKKNPPNPPSADDGFAAFWAVWPRKVAREAAVKAWTKLAPDAALQAVILAAVARQRQWPQWVKDGGQYIPHPASWLNGRRWEDELNGAVGSPPHDIDAEMAANRARLAQWEAEAADPDVHPLT